MAEIKIENAWREIHGPGEHARKRQYGGMFRRIGGHAPGIVFLPARAFAAEPVGVGAAQAGILDRLVRIDADMVPRRRLEHAHMVAHHELAVMPFMAPDAGTVTAHNIAAIGDIAGFDLAHAHFFIEREGIFHLALVIVDIARRFLMADQAHALFAAVIRDRLEIKIRIGPGEAELGAIVKPVPVPARIPAFHQHAVKAMPGSKIHITHGVFRRRAMFGARAPGHGADVHAPPDADIFAGLDPGDIAERIGRIQIENQTRIDQAYGPWRDLDGPPRAVKGRRLADQNAIGPGRQRCLEMARAPLLQRHARIIHQRRLVKAHINPARGFQGHGRVHGGCSAQRRFAVKVFIAVPAMRRDPPGRRCRIERELRQFVSDAQGTAHALLRHLIAEPHPIIENAKTDAKAALRPPQ